MPVVGREFVVTTPAEWAAVSSPARFELLEFMRLLTPCSLADLGRAMARAPDSLYHHMRVLCRAGIAVRTGDRAVGGDASISSGGGGATGRKEGRREGRREAVFDLARRQFRFEIDPVTGRNVQAVKRITAMLTRLTSRAMSHAFDAGLPVGEGPAKQIWARAETAWLDDAALAEANAHLVALDAIFERGRVDRRGRLFYLSFFLAPAVRPERNRRGTRAGPAASESSDRTSKTISDRTSRTPSQPTTRRRNQGAKTWHVPTA